ncbi:MAG: hypothetical protein AAGE52_11275 [Myxococcota bacterium]
MIRLLPLLLACGPSLSALVEEGDHRGAVCHFEADPSEASPLDEAVSDALNLQVHLHVVDANDARRVLGQRLPASFHQRAALLRLRHQSSALDVDYFDLVPSARVDGRYVNVMPDRPALAALVGEELPSPRRQHRRHRGNGLAVFLHFLARPLRTLAGQGPRYRRGFSTVGYRSPTDAEIARTAPATQRIHEQIRTGCSSPGAACERFLVLPRSEGTITLSLARRVAVLSTDRDRPFACSLTREFRVELPVGGTLEARLAAVFGPALQPLREIARPGPVY